MSVAENNNEGLQVKSKVEEWAGESVKGGSASSITDEESRLFKQLLNKGLSPFGLTVRDSLRKSEIVIDASTKLPNPNIITIEEIFAQGVRAGIALREDKKE